MPPVVTELCRSAGYAYAPMALLRSCRVIHPKQQIIVQGSEIS
ncbi:MAG: hypothetical protein RMY27_34725 [Nostoc sp. DedQUE09]|nr:hypothetical protein [Nostoc sp. DedQUE09]